MTSISNDSFNADPPFITTCRSGNLSALRSQIGDGLVLTDAMILNAFARKDILVHTDVAMVLIDHITDINYHDDYNYTFLICASGAGNVVIVETLLERGATWGVFNRINDPSRDDALHSASYDGYIEVVKLLVDWHTKREPIHSDSIMKAFVYSSIEGHLNLVKYFVEYGPDPMAIYNALNGAIANNRVDVAEYLLDLGADVSIDGNVMTDICSRGYHDMVRLVLSKGADPNKNNNDDVSPLQASLVYPDIINELLEHGVDPDQRFAYGSTAMIDVVSFGRIECLTVLLQHGAEPNLALAHTGDTALMVAAAGVHVDCVRLLLEYRADVAQLNHAGQSVLDIMGDDEMYAEVVQLCLEYLECNRPEARAILK